MSELENQNDFNKNRSILHALGAIGFFSSLFAIMAIFLYYIFVLDKRESYRKDLREVLDFQFFWLLTNLVFIVLTFTWTTFNALILSIGVMPVGFTSLLTGLFTMVAMIYGFLTWIIGLNPIFSVILINQDKPTFYIPTGKEIFSVIDRLPRKWVSILLFENTDETID